MTSDPKILDQFEDHVITDVRDSGKYYELCADGGWLAVEKAKFSAPPQVGQVARYYGRGFGFPVRGLDVDGAEVYYETEEGYRIRMAIQQVERESAEMAEADAARAERDAQVAALPECFQKRIARFRRNNADFYWKYEGYEMAACVDAVNIAEEFREADNASDAIRAFFALPWSEQKSMVPDLSDDHSGNTFGMACRLAVHYMTDERLVFADHAAIAPLTGCECGCPPVTDDEMIAAGYAPFGSEGT